tara:strand:- start:128 stop:364 length:237 start_codon:yes stop_codon:yes gene_type:complete
MQTNLPKFYSYVESFYGGENPIYQLDGGKATIKEIKVATNMHLDRLKKSAGVFLEDSTDREMVRDIILENRNQQPWGL